MNNPVLIGSRLVGTGNSCFVIAEAGVNHNGDMRLAHRLIDEAVSAGADAVKFQSFVTEALITADTPKARYQVDTTGEGDSQYAMLKALELSADQQMQLKAHCDRAGITYLCTPYDNSSLELLDRLHIAAFKVASTDTNNIPFLRAMARKARPVLLSTGMSSLGEVEQAVETLRSGKLAGNIVILHCTAEYPAPVHEVNLRAMLTMQQAFLCPVGFSDHTAGVGASPWAVALGACVIEKHFTLDRSLPGPDHRASLMPLEMADLVREIRLVEAALGDGIKRLMPSELSNKRVMQKSVVAVKAVEAGSIIRLSDLTCKRPAAGLTPSWIDRIVGKRAARPISAAQNLSLLDVDWDNS